jgi:hypothetical protein
MAAPPGYPFPQPPGPIECGVTPEPQEVTVAGLQADVQRLANWTAAQEQRLEALDGIQNPIQAPAQDEPDPGA